MVCFEEIMVFLEAILLIQELVTPEFSKSKLVTDAIELRQLLSKQQGTAEVFIRVEEVKAKQEFSGCFTNI